MFQEPMKSTYAKNGRPNPTPFWTEARSYQAQDQRVAPHIQTWKVSVNLLDVDLNFCTRYVSVT